MQAKQIVKHALTVGALLVASAVAQAASLVTFNPQNGNNGLGVIDAATASFQSSGATAQLTSTLNINSNSGSTSFTETGTITLNDFDGVLQSVSHVNTNYRIFGDFSLSGTGSWTGSVFTAAPGVTFNGTLYADPAGAAGPFTLGTFAIDPFSFQFALAIAIGSVAPNSTGSASTTLSATLDFTPAAGTTGSDGFFQAPFPLALQIGVGNAGGNSLNTSYSVNSSGTLVAFNTPGNQPNAGPGSADLTFVTRPVPEPGALSLAGIALLALALSKKRQDSSAS